MANNFSPVLIVAIVVLIVVIFVAFILLQHYRNKNNYYRKIEGAGPTDSKKPKILIWGEEYTIDSILPTENDFIGLTERLDENELDSIYSDVKIGSDTIEARQLNNITQEFRIIYVPAYEKIISYFKCMLTMINECIDYEYYHFPVEDFIKFTKDNPPNNFNHYFDDEYDKKLKQEDMKLLDELISLVDDSENGKDFVGRYLFRTERKIENMYFPDDIIDIYDFNYNMPVERFESCRHITDASEFLEYKYDDSHNEFSDLLIDSLNEHILINPYYTYSSIMEFNNDAFKTPKNLKITYLKNNVAGIPKNDLKSLIQNDNELRNVLNKRKSDVKSKSKSLAEFNEYVRENGNHMTYELYHTYRFTNNTLMTISGTKNNTEDLLISRRVTSAMYFDWSIENFIAFTKLRNNGDALYIKVKCKPNSYVNRPDIIDVYNFSKLKCNKQLHIDFPNLNTIIYNTLNACEKYIVSRFVSYNNMFKEMHAVLSCIIDGKLIKENEYNAYKSYIRNKECCVGIVDTILALLCTCEYIVYNIKDSVTYDLAYLSYSHKRFETLISQIQSTALYVLGNLVHVCNISPNTFRKILIIKKDIPLFQKIDKFLGGSITFSTRNKRLDIFDNHNVWVVIDRYDYLKFLRSNNMHHPNYDRFISSEIERAYENYCYKLQRGEATTEDEDEFIEVLCGNIHARDFTCDGGDDENRYNFPHFANAIQILDVAYRFYEEASLDEHELSMERSKKYDLKRMMHEMEIEKEEQRKQNEAYLQRMRTFHTFH